MYWKNILLTLLIITEFYMISNAGRSSGSRGGGSGSVRTSSGFRSSRNSRSVSYSRIRVSARYSSWTKTHGLRSNFRFSTTSYSYKRNAIITGLIIMSDHQRERFDTNRASSFNGISVCYNEFPLYDRNITLSPWFMCPWNDPSYRYCCGDEIEEQCCRYFDRKGHLAGLIIGVFILITLVIVSSKYCCKCVKSRKKFSATIVYKSKKPIYENRTEGNSLVAIGNASAPEYPPNIGQIDMCPAYPPSIPVIENYPQYLLNPIIPSYLSDSIPQYPVNPVGFVDSINVKESIQEHHYHQPSTINSYDDNSNLHYSLTPPVKPPPSYSDVMKQ